MDRVAPPGGSRAPSASRAPGAPLTPTQAPGSSSRRRMCPLRDRLTPQFKLRSPLLRRLADRLSLPAQPPRTSAPGASGQEGGGGPAAGSPSSQVDAASPPQSTGVRASERGAGFPRAAHGVPDPMQPHQRARVSFSLAGELRSCPPCWFLGRSCCGKRPGLTLRRQTPRQDPQGSGNPRGQPGMRHQDEGQQFLRADDGGVQSTLRVRPPS
ncbi:hypothetical protein NDU88_008851 [Pleurodeles waltl]|uniref:Uncharacterized protein n=1 Tax=Pleurodeles waltl TaxID=8319 RepID=A0AAV7PRL1_PLEWA|nr:hypothetical protein NDU88_008851 [Pleurodeles waltl]